MLKLFAYLRPYWRIALLGPILMLIEVGVDLLQPLLMARIIDNGIAYGDVPYIIQTGLLMVGIALLGALAGVGATVFSSRASQSFAADLRFELYKKVQGFSFANLDKFKTSSLITRLTNDVTQVQHIVQMSLRMMVRAPFLCLGSIILAVAINARLALILLVTIPILGVITFIVIRKAIPLFTLVQARLDRINAVVRENLAGVRVVKAFNGRQRENQRFAVANGDLVEVTQKAFRLVAITMPLIMLVMNLSIVAIIWFGGIQVNQGTMLVGEVAAFINYMMQILFSLMMVAFIFMMISRSKVSADRINEVLNEEATIEDPANSDTKTITRGEIVFKNVAFKYHPEQGEANLKGINLTVLPGQLVAILGGTGSGKSSLVNLIPRLYDVTEGQILIDGRDIRTIKLDVLRRGIGMVLQEATLFSGTILENIRWGKEDATEAEVINASQKASIHDFIQDLPLGYDTLIGQKGVNLSGGQKQRLTIARALVKDPKILILDDSTSAVDVATEAKILDFLKQGAKTTTLLVAQRISTVIGADNIIVLDNGEIVGQGTHAELLQTNGLYQDIYHSQMGEVAVNG